MHAHEDVGLVDGDHGRCQAVREVQACDVCLPMVAPSQGRQQLLLIQDGAGGILASGPRYEPYLNAAGVLVQQQQSAGCEAPCNSLQARHIVRFPEGLVPVVEQPCDSWVLQVLSLSGTVTSSTCMLCIGACRCLCEMLGCRC